MAGLSRAAWSRGECVAAGAVFALAFALRALHLREIRIHDPYFALPTTAARAYQQWATEIAGGDWIGGEGVFVFAPLYAYFLAFLHAVFGSGALVPGIAHCAIGALSCVLVVALGRRLFDRRVALIAGAICAAYSTLIFYGGMLAVANVLVPLALLLVLAGLRAEQSPSAARWFGVGVVFGLCALGQQVLLLFAPVLAAWPLLSRGASLSRARSAVSAILLCAGAAAVIAPVALRNFVFADEFTLLYADTGISFYTGNQPNANGTYGMPRVYPRVVADAPIEQRRLFTAVAEQIGERELGPAAVSGFWLREGLASIAADPVRWMRREIYKLGQFWNAAEPWNDRSPSAERALSSVRRLPLFAFGVVAPLALLGMAIAAREWRRLYLLYVVIAVQLVASLIFSVLARDRIAAVPALILFASFAACWFWERARERRYSALAAGIAVVAVAASLVHLPLARENLARAHYELGDRFAQLEQWDLAIEYFGRSLNRDPGAVSAWSKLALTYEARGGGKRDAVHSWLRVLDLARRERFQLHVERAEQHLRALGFEPLVGPPGGH